NDLPQPTFSSLAVSEPNNFVEHFIDSSGVISWRFFSDRTDLDFHEWDFAGTTAEEAERLYGLLADQGLEAYVMEHEDLGAPVCRILVPGYSEVYPVEDLVWDNTNMALEFRSDILNLHSLEDERLADLLERLEESQLDDHIKVGTLIGIEFDDNTVWSELTILELKLLIEIALGEYEAALEHVQMFLQFNDNTVQRGLFHQAMQAVLEIALDDDLDFNDYHRNFTRMFGEETMRQVIGAVNDEVRFPGLTPTSMGLEGIDRHQRLIESYKKLHAARAAGAGIATS
ncbi:YcaO-like family protein, partial [Chromohalobacter sp. 296-RDG]|uniref:YcaO-like family protein n=1 Tax=Chromohalobacter sp. 296-RDG TaxID=2994062 RepID=UPI002468F9F0